MSSTMRGAGRAKRHVSTFLETRFPAYLAARRLEWSRTEETLPDPKAYLPNEPRALDRWPLIAVTSPRMTGLVQTDVRSDGTIEYDTTYGLRVYVWVNTAGWEEAIEMRDDLAAALRSILVDHRTLDVAGDVAVLDDTTLVEEHSDVAQVKGDRFVAGAALAFELHVVESVQRTSAGNVSSTELITERLPHPALS